MRSCSVIKNLAIVRGCVEDYTQLSGFHYRDSRLGPYAAIFVLKPTGAMRNRMGEKTVGVIVYKMPSPGLELRNVATNGFFTGYDRATRIALVNKNIRCIGRVIIEPRFRGLGLAAKLVRKTVTRLDVPIIEAVAVMGLVNPFFEKAGMTAYTAPMSARCVQLIEALSLVGIEKNELIDSQKVHTILQKLCGQDAEFIESQIQHFLQSYGKSKYIHLGSDRTRFVLSKLTARPAYYIWFNKNLELRI